MNQRSEDVVRGELAFLVLLTVANLGDAAYGAEIRRVVIGKTGRDYSVGAIYATLQRLEGKGLLTSYESAPLPVRGGRSRRQFLLTIAGKSALREATRTRERVWKGLVLGEGEA